MSGGTTSYNPQGIPHAPAPPLSSARDEVSDGSSTDSLFGGGGNEDESAERPTVAVNGGKEQPEDLPEDLHESEHSEHSPVWKSESSEDSDNWKLLPAWGAEEEAKEDVFDSDASEHLPDWETDEEVEKTEDDKDPEDTYHKKAPEALVRTNLHAREKDLEQEPEDQAKCTAEIHEAYQAAERAARKRGAGTRDTRREARKAAKRTATERGARPGSVRREAREAAARDVAGRAVQPVVELVPEPFPESVEPHPESVAKPVKPAKKKQKLAGKKKKKKKKKDEGKIQCAYWKLAKGSKPTERCKNMFRPTGSFYCHVETHETGWNC